MIKVKQMSDADIEELRNGVVEFCGVSWAAKNSGLYVYIDNIYEGVLCGKISAAWSRTSGFMLDRDFVGAPEPYEMFVFHPSCKQELISWGDVIRARRVFRKAAAELRKRLTQGLRDLYQIQKNQYSALKAIARTGLKENEFIFVWGILENEKKKSPSNNILYQSSCGGGHEIDYIPSDDDRYYFQDFIKNADDSDQKYYMNELDSWVAASMAGSP